VFGNFLRRLTAERAAEKAQELAIAKNDLPAMWIAANIDVLKRAMAAAAQDGKRSVDLESSYVRIGRDFYQYEPVSLGAITLRGPLQCELSDALFSALSKALRAEDVKLGRETRETRFQRKPLVYIQWLIKW
jgi:hypothetical protein